MKLEKNSIIIISMIVIICSLILGMNESLSNVYHIDDNIRMDGNYSETEGKGKLTIETENEQVGNIIDYPDISKRPWENWTYNAKQYTSKDIQEIIIDSCIIYSTIGDVVDLTQGTVGGAIEKIGLKAFYGMESVEKVTIRERSRVKTIGNYAFSGTAIEEITLPSTCETIGANAFDNCKKLKNVYLNEGLKVIDFGAFWNCESLQEIRIPSTVESIWGPTFSGCDSLENIIVTKGQEKVISQLEAQGYGDKIKIVGENYIIKSKAYNKEGILANKKYILTTDNNQLFNSDVILDEEHSNMSIDEYIIYLINNKDTSYYVWETDPEGKINLVGNTSTYTGFYNGKAYINGEILKSVIIALPKGTNIASDANTYVSYEDITEEKLKELETLKEKYDIYPIDENGDLGYNIVGNDNINLIIGDVNVDGKVDLTDAVILNKYLAGAIEFGTIQINAADCYSDGEINMQDSIALLRFLVRLENELPVDINKKEENKNFVKEINDEFYNTYMKAEMNNFEFTDVAKLIHKEISKEAQKEEGKMKYTDEDVEIKEIYKDGIFGEKINTSSYIGMCLYEYGIDTRNEELIEYITECQGKIYNITEEKLNELGWQKFAYNSKEQLEKGDIVVSEKEGQIYLENGVYSCDNEESIKNNGLLSPAEPEKGKYIIRIEPKSGKIGESIEWSINEDKLEVNIKGNTENMDTIPWKASINNISTYKVVEDEENVDTAIRLVGASIQQSIKNTNIRFEITTNKLTDVIKKLKNQMNLGYSIVDYKFEFSSNSNLFKAIFILKKCEGNSQIQICDDYDVRVSSGKNVVRNVEDFKRIFEGYGIISEHAEAFMEMQEKYGVNAVFAAAVSRRESSGGNNGDLVGNGDRNNNTTGYPYNMFSLTKWSGTLSSEIYNIQIGEHDEWMEYNSFDQAIMDFGKYISERHFSENRFKVSEIQEVYEPGVQSWRDDVNSYMTGALERLND